MTRNPIIRAVIFDWGGVFQRTADPAPREALAAELAMDRATMERAIFESPAYEAASLGRLGARAAWVEVAAALGWGPQRADELVERFFAGDAVDATLVALVGRLRASGLRVALLSNALPPRDGTASRAGTWGEEGLFDAQVFSYQVGALKPAAATYCAALAAVGVPAGEALFVDDVPANVAAARALGMHALQYLSTPELLESLRGLDLPV